METGTGLTGLRRPQWRLGLYPKSTGRQEAGGSVIWLEFVLPRYGYRVGNGLPRRSHPRSPRMSGNSWVSSPEPLWGL